MTWRETAIRAVSITALIILLTAFVTISGLLFTSQLVDAPVTLYFNRYGEQFIELLLVNVVGSAVIAVALTYLIERL